jgi:hypothetical protein
MANTVIQILRSYANTIPASLADGELAYSFVANALYIGSNTGNILLIGGTKLLENVTVSVANVSIETMNADGGEF